MPVLAVFAVIAFAWAVVIVVVLPAKAVDDVVPNAKLEVPAPILDRIVVLLELLIPVLSTIASITWELLNWVFVFVTVSVAVAIPVTWPLLSRVISCIYVLPELFELLSAEIFGWAVK